jgi:soluble lytic murein transglycosylase
LPFVDEVERWRPQVHGLLEEVRAEGRLTGAASSVDEDLVLAVVEQESSGDPEAESDAGALGLMQLMPETFAWIMGIHDWGEDVSDVDRSQIVDVPSNLRAGIRFLAAVLDEQGGSLYWALASYNAGGGVVNRWRAAGFSSVPAGDGYEETANYGPAILANYAAHHPDAQVG